MVCNILCTDVLLMLTAAKSNFIFYICIPDNMSALTVYSFRIIKLHYFHTHQQLHIYTKTYIKKTKQFNEMKIIQRQAHLSYNHLSW